MFGSLRKKNRHSAQPLTSATANPNAATAAAAVFGRQDSNASLSSAAAAAALKARPTSPINVGEVQTRRTQRRSASVSSNGSHHDSRRPHLQRAPSQSSMTERTFRSPSPSPHRPATSSGAQHEAPPPVPAIPDNIRSEDGGASSKSPQKRQSNLHTTPFRVASQRQQNGDGSWFGAATEHNISHMRKSDEPLRTRAPDPRPGAVSPSSSFNFSYPRGSRVGSPPPMSPTVERPASITNHQQTAAPGRADSTASRSSAASDTTLVYDPNSRRMVPKSDLFAREQHSRPVTEKPAQKKRQSQQQQPQQPQQPAQQQTGLARSGSHLAKGTVARLKGTAVESHVEPPKTTTPSEQHPRQETPPAAEPSEPQSLRLVTRPKAATSEPTADPPVFQYGEKEFEQTTPEPQPRTQSPIEHDSLDAPVVADVRASDGATILPHVDTKQSNPVIAGRSQGTANEREDSDDLLTDEDEEAGPVHATKDTDPGSAAQADTVRSTARSPPATELSNHARTQSPAIQSHSPSPALKRYESVRSEREQSSSPARSARFALGTEQLVVKHEPPPRSLSPRKSALKQSTSPSRGASPSEDGSEVSGFGYAGAPESEEAIAARKKANRVSFDDRNTTVVGEAAQDQQPDSPVVPSPQQTRRPWFSNIGKSKKRDMMSLDDDEVMKPRPALPMFGSVREKKVRDAEERPLVRPADSSQSPVADTPTTIASSPDGENVQDPLEQSADQNIGAIITQDMATKHEPNTSRYREPLPPVVTSLEGNGYYSPSSSSDEDDDATYQANGTEITSAPGESRDVQSAESKSITNAHDHHLKGSAVNDTQSSATEPIDRQRDVVPSIAITSPSPGELEMRTAEEEQPVQRASYFDVPGGFPEDEDEDIVQSSENNEPQLAQNQPALSRNRGVPAPLDLASEESDSDELDDAPNSPVSRAPQVETIKEESESSSGSSIYSDAYEDMSDMEGDGFQSLDAVLTTPIKTKSSPPKTPQDSPTAGQEASKQQEEFQKSTASAATPAAFESQDDWENAKAYWRGLTAEKRKQLESEAQEEAGVEGDKEETPQPKKHKKKRASRGNENAAQPTATSTDRVYQIAPGTKMNHDTHEKPATRRLVQKQQPAQQQEMSGGKLRKSLRGSQNGAAASTATAGEPGMRKSMRSYSDETARNTMANSVAAAGAGGGMRKSLRQNSTQHSTASSARPVSYHAGAAPQDAPQRLSKHKKQSSLDSPAASAAMATSQPSLRRRGSDSSESSFRRMRPQKSGMGFRKSMRASSPEPERPSTANRSSRFSIRSLSPPAVPSPQSNNRGNMRSTLRSGNSSDGSTSRMRFPGLGRSGKKAAEKKKRERFADSSDEDEVHPSRSFRSSRIPDSSDEDEPVRAPAGGSFSKKSMRNGRASGPAAAAAAMKVPIPRPNDAAEESPELPDSSDDEQVMPRRTPSGRKVQTTRDTSGLQRKRSGRGEISPLAPAAENGAVEERPSHNRRGSFLGSVLRRKKDRDSGKIAKPARTESFARQDTKLERSSEELSALRQQNASPKLQKQRTGSWPLRNEEAEEPQTKEEQRPSSSGVAELPSMEAGAPKKHGFMKRRSISYSGVGAVPAHHHHDDESVMDGSQADGSTKKKKFGKLRKMFGLRD